MPNTCLIEIHQYAFGQQRITITKPATNTMTYDQAL